MTEVEETIRRLGIDRWLAAFLALGARNGIEPHHAMVKDSQMSDFNRAMRREIYQALIAYKRSEQEDDPNRDWYAKYCKKLQQRPELESRQQLVAGAVRRQAENFLAGEKDRQQVRQLAQAAEYSALEYLKLFQLFSSGQANLEEMKLFYFAAVMIPDYWEPAETSEEFKKHI